MELKNKKKKPLSVTYNKKKMIGLLQSFMSYIWSWEATEPSEEQKRLPANLLKSILDHRQLTISESSYTKPSLLLPQLTEVQQVRSNLRKVPVNDTSVKVYPCTNPLFMELNSVRPRIPPYADMSRLTKV